VLRRLPGLTGDVYGALCELLEALVLLAFVAGGTHAA
jgi:cobalamin synthase